MGWRPRLLCCLFLSLSLAAAAHAATVRQEWEISYQFKSLDCVRKLAVTINGQTPGRPDAEPFRYDGEHDVLFSNWWRKITYEQATGLASVLLVWVGEPQSLLINCCGTFVSCSVMAAGACNATVPEYAAPVFPVVPGKTYRFRIASVTSLSALNFEIEDHNARLFTYAKKPITVEAVASGTTSSRRPPMGYQQYAAALVAVMLFVAVYLAADQNPAVDESTIARSGPAGSASGSLPVGGGHAPPPSPASASSSSSTDAAYRNRSSATSSTSGEETVLTEEDPGGPPGSPPQRPVVPPAVPLAENVVVSSLRPTALPSAKGFCS